MGDVAPTDGLSTDHVALASADVCKSVCLSTDGVGARGGRDCDVPGADSRVWLCAVVGVDVDAVTVSAAERDSEDGSGDSVFSPAAFLCWRFTADTSLTVPEVCPVASNIDPFCDAPCTL
jgi:hypothetical protein